jgi:hypothetical protein
MADLESKSPSSISVQFTDGSSVLVEGYSASYIWLHLRNSSDLLPLLYRSNGTYREDGLTIPIKALLEENYGEPLTR